MRKRPKELIVTHYMMIDGEKVEIDPLKTHLPDKCKLVLAELATGMKCELVDPEDEKTIRTMPRES